MDKKIKLIKTLPHLIQLFIKKEETILYALQYSNDIVKFFENLKSYEKNEIKFTWLLKYIAGLEDKNKYKNQASELLKDNFYTREDKVHNKLQYSVKGDTISIWPVGYEHPIKLEFFGEDCEAIYLFDEDFGRKMYGVDGILLSSFIPEDKADRDSISYQLAARSEQLNEDAASHKLQATSLSKIIFTNSINNIAHNESLELIITDFQYPQLFYSRFDLLENEIKALESKGYKIYIKTKNRENLPEKFSKYIQLKSSNFEIINSNLSEVDIPAGLISEQLKLAIFTDRELFGSIYLTRPERIKSISSNIKKLLRQFEGEIEIGDYVVHEDYGLGIYSGLTQEKVDDEMMEYLLIKYDAGDELFVPLHQIEKITKYIGPEGVAPKITRLGKVTWEHIKAKIKKSTSILARELIEHYAKREVSEAKPLPEGDSKDYKHFVDSFKYSETEDQLRATNEILGDLEKDKPMNRLLVGDVGFGKTEVFMRAAFKIVEYGGQVAVLAPTTILTAQHYAVLKERFKDFPFTVAYLSRFNSKKQNNEIIDKLNEGKIDIVVGTHRLLASDVKFKNLQMVVVDEEQKFGVKQKEKIKQLNYGVHVLSVSATPIPRTLSMALSAIQDISIISQPPKNRKSVQTEILKDDHTIGGHGWNTVSKAIIHEVERNGQVYFLHNEVQSIQAIKAKLNNLLPGIKFVVAHGQMRPSDLDKVMTDFYEHKYDCLISTTIIENGLDVPNVNTIIINKAQKFGLSQLYQLRGRVGRSDRQSYCYLMYQGRIIQTSDVRDQESENKLPNKKYLERLQAMVDNQDLGAGFRIASRDLEIRGAGNLLGEQQSGHISTIGYALYIEILAQEVEKIKASIAVTQ